MIKQGFQKPAMVAQITEAWVAKSLKSGSSRGLKPSEDPNRAEAILIALHILNRSLIGCARSWINRLDTLSTVNASWILATSVE